MKKSTTILIAGLLLLALTGVNAQNPMPLDESSMHLGTATNDRVERAIKNYAMALASENDGLIESSLYYALRLRIERPEIDLGQLEKAIDRLVVEGKTQSIRYKAYLASTVYASPSLVDRREVDSTRDISSFFASVSEQLQHRLLVRNN